jgi:hypothetical protein
MEYHLAQRNLEVKLYVCKPDDSVYKDAETCNHVIFNF